MASELVGRALRGGGHTGAQDSGRPVRVWAGCRGSPCSLGLCGLVRPTADWTTVDTREGAC